MYRRKCANQELRSTGADLWRLKIPLYRFKFISKIKLLKTPSIALLWLSVIITAHAQSDNKQQLEQQLAAVRQKLQLIQTEIQQSQRAFTAEAAALRRVETDISGTRREITGLSSRIAEQRRALIDLDKKASGLAQNLKTQTRQLASAVRFAWASGEGSGLRALLNIDDLAGATRQWHYQRLIANARAQQLAQLKDNLQELINVRAAAASRREALETQRQQQSKREAELVRQQVERGQAIELLNQAITKKQQQSASLTADTERLNQLIEELAELFADIPTQLDGDPGLPSPAGNLRLPVEGRILQGAGTAKSLGMHRLGLLISAASGSEVSAVSYGRVAYADWLRGFGLLTIVDHGDGYLSLYAFNESLYREVGDWVAAGDVIAAAGASGGRSTPALYFELRRNGQPVDPRPWLE